MPQANYIPPADEAVTVRCPSCGQNLALQFRRLREGRLYCGLCSTRLPYALCRSCEIPLELEPRDNEQGAFSCPRCSRRIQLDQMDRMQPDDYHCVYPWLAGTLMDGRLRIDLSHSGQTRRLGFGNFIIGPRYFDLSVLGFALYHIFALHSFTRHESGTRNSIILLSDQTMILRKGKREREFRLQDLASMRRLHNPLDFGYDEFVLKFSRSGTFRLSSYNKAYWITLEALVGRLKRIPEVAHFARQLEGKRPR